MADTCEAVWRALGDPVRRTILDMLRAGPQTTGAIARRFDQTRFGVMKHLRVLEACGLVVVERRGRERWNYLNAVALTQATGRWLTPFQQAWASRLGALSEYLTRGETAMTKPNPAPMDIRLEIRLPAPPARVFDALTREIGTWWVYPYRQAGEVGEITLEPTIGAPMLEIGAAGHAVIWGRIEEIRPASRLYLSGRFAVVGAVAGRVHLDLEPDGAGTLLKVAHTAVGDILDETRANFERGWRDLADVRLRAHLAR